jgi:hypothetical protein
MPKRLLLCDLDDTIVNFNEQLQLYLWRQTCVWIPRYRFGGWELSDTIYTVLAEEAYGNGRITSAYDVAELLRNDFMRNPAPYAAANPCFPLWNALRHLDDSVDIIFITARNEDALSEVTHLWLEEWDLPGYPVIHSNDKPEEIEAIANAYADRQILYVDDKGQDVYAVSKNVPGVDCMLVEQPWNADLATTLKRWTHEQIATRLSWWRHQ